MGWIAFAEVWQGMNGQLRAMYFSNVFVFLNIFFFKCICISKCLCISKCICILEEKLWVGGTTTGAAEVSQGLDRQPRVANHVPQTKQCAAVCSVRSALCSFKKSTSVRQTKQCAEFKSRIYVPVRPRHCCKSVHLKVKLPASWLKYYVVLIICCVF